MKWTLLCALLLAPLASYAETGPSYNYVALGFLWTDGTVPGGIHFDEEYGVAEISIEVGEYIHLHADVLHGETHVYHPQFGQSKYDAKGNSFLVGGHFAVSPRTDFVAEVGYDELDLARVGHFRSYTVHGGLVSAVSDRAEIGVRVGYHFEDGDADQNAVEVWLDASYLLTEHISIGGSMTHKQHVGELYSVNVAYEW